MEKISIFEDPGVRILNGNNLENEAPFNQGYYDQGDLVGMVVKDLGPNRKYIECYDGKLEIAYENNAKACIDYSTFTQSGSQSNQINIQADISKWLSNDSLHTGYITLKDSSGQLVHASSITFEFLR